MGLSRRARARALLDASCSPGGRWGQEGLRAHQVHDTTPLPVPSPLFRCAWLPGAFHPPPQPPVQVRLTPWRPAPSSLPPQAVPRPGHRPAVTAGSGLGLNTAILLANADAPWGSPARLKAHWLSAALRPADRPGGGPPATQKPLSRAVRALGPGSCRPLPLSRHCPLPSELWKETRPRAPPLLPGHPPRGPTLRDRPAPQRERRLQPGRGTAVRSHPGPGAWGDDARPAGAGRRPQAAGGDDVFAESCSPAGPRPYSQARDI